jgi:hypothetical protein
MAEIDNEFIVRLPREIQATQAEHSRTFADHTERFIRLEKRRDEVHESMVTALGLAAHANIRHDGVDQRLDELTRRVEALEKTR